MPRICNEQAPVPPPSYSRAQVQAQAQRARALPINALSLMQSLHPAGLVPLGGAASPSTLSSAVAQRTRRGAAHLPRRVEAHDRRPENAVAALPTWDMHDWLVSWPALALACGLPQRANGVPRIPSPSQLCKRGPAAGAPPFETLFVLTMWRAVRCRLIGARESLHR